MHGGHLSEEEPMAEMNLIPLIDIALTLLIILMVTTAFIRKPGVALKLPETKTHEGKQETNKDMVILVTQQGEYYMDGKPTPAAEVQNRLKQKAAVDPKSRILVKGDRNAVWAQIMSVMDMARQAGLTQIVFPTEPKHDTDTAPSTLPATNPVGAAPPAAAAVGGSTP